MPAIHYHTVSCLQGRTIASQCGLAFRIPVVCALLMKRSKSPFTALSPSVCCTPVWLNPQFRLQEDACAGPDITPWTTSLLTNSSLPASKNQVEYLLQQTLDDIGSLGWRKSLGPVHKSSQLCSFLSTSVAKSQIGQVMTMKAAFYVNEFQFCCMTVLLLITDGLMFIPFYLSSTYF